MRPRFRPILDDRDRRAGPAGREGGAPGRTCPHDPTPGDRTMFLWELLAQRLRANGWKVWHQKHRGPTEPTYVVHLHRPGVAWSASGPTLTDAFAEALRR